MRTVLPKLNGARARCHALWLLSLLGSIVLAEEPGLTGIATNPAARPGQGIVAPAMHWAFQPVRRPPVPPSTLTGRAHDPVDQFITTRLEQENFRLSTEAERRTLIRRLSFDVTGLPPLPEEATAFENDRRPDAYERLVERLLASPRYGERWARHWLDAVRFAETHGFEMNQPRPNAWPYRDYVIRAFNEDKTYDRFVVEQIAGDVLGVNEATGFLVGGPWDQVKSPDAVLTANQRADELHDIVSTTSSAFLGLTVGCARCHDHKFDPIPQTDYFAIKACFEGVQHGERKLRTPEVEAQARELELRRERMTEVERALEEFEPLTNGGPLNTNRLRAAVHPRRNVERFAAVAVKRLRFTVSATTDAEPCIDELEVYTAEANPRNIALASLRTSASASSVYPNSDIHRLDHINDGRHGNSRSWISNERGKGWVELEFPEVVAVNRVVWGRDREARFSDRLAIDYRIEIATASNDWRLIASSVDRTSYRAGMKAQPVFDTNHFVADELERARKLVTERAELEVRIKELSRQPMIYGGTFAAQPGLTHRFHRGDPMQLREIVPPGGLTQIGGRTAGLFRKAADEVTEKTVPAPAWTEDQRRRLALAEWIIAPTNPLTARVMVNRIWQHHFGEGIVSTPSDFGVNGARPTHPELLDWLATEFVAHGWSVKHIHRLILSSATYRQSSAPRAECLAADASSRLLWRFPPRRLEAEAIRDAILSVSGKLDLKSGGPGFSFFEPNDNYVRVYEPKAEYGPETWRRMVYGTVIRQRPDGVFGAFDCPDAGQIAPKRTRSTTPLQALNLLNSPFITQQAGFFAARIEREAGLDQKARIRHAFALAFNRAPDGRETAEALKLVREQGLPIFCRALFNANEFVYSF